jgi:Na+/H+ antiporter NhaD/arsenite permease-like protein
MVPPQPPLGAKEPFRWGKFFLGMGIPIAAAMVTGVVAALGGALDEATSGSVGGAIAGILSMLVSGAVFVG